VGFVLTHNRDESKLRASNTGLVVDECLFMPVDMHSGGTWIGSNGKITAAILNGHRNIHQRKQSYTQSRGNLIPALLKIESLALFIKNTNFSDFESFTLLVIENDKVFELVWDEQVLTTVDMTDNGDLVYSSATLYSKKVKTERQNSFKDYMKNSKDKITSIWNFHNAKGPDHAHYVNVDYNDLISTVSITQITQNPFTVKYLNTRSEVLKTYNFVN
jgi:uncharacterized protein with NRDE domain